MRVAVVVMGMIMIMFMVVLGMVMIVARMIMQARLE